MRDKFQGRIEEKDWSLNEWYEAASVMYMRDVVRHVADFSAEQSKAAVDSASRMMPHRLYTSFDVAIDMRRLARNKQTRRDLIEMITTDLSMGEVGDALEGYEVSMYDRKGQRTDDVGNARYVIFHFEPYTADW